MNVPIGLLMRDQIDEAVTMHEHIEMQRLSALAAFQEDDTQAKSLEEEEDRYSLICLSLHHAGQFHSR